MNPDVLAALGPLALAVEPDTTDLCVAGNGTVWVRGDAGFRPASVTLDVREVRRIAVTLIEMGGGRVDDAKPMGDAALPGSVRAHAVLPPIARDGAALSLRFPRGSPIGVDDYRVPSGFDWDDLVDHSTLVCGVTGSGKTTLVETLLGRCAVNERIVVLEDIAELRSTHPHVAHLTTRSANAESAGEVTLGSLVRESLRMSPDRIVVGEMRGAEIVDVLLALTSGHRGFATVHTRSLDHLPVRLHALGGVAGLDSSSVNRLVATAFDRVVFCQRVDGNVALETARLIMSDDELRVER